jgi:hypothetical protein
VTLSAGDLALEIHLGHDDPGMILQRLEPDGWRDYLLDGEPVVFDPLDSLDALPPGKYRLWLPVYSLKGRQSLAALFLSSGKHQ